MPSLRTLRLIPPLLLMPIVGGCSVVDDFGQYEFCVDAELTLDELSTADTSGEADDFVGSCGGAGSPDVAYRFQAPRGDYYRFSTAGSDFDTLLYLRSSCDGPELACSNNSEGMPTSEVVERIEEDAVVVVVVDGNSDAGNASIGVEHVSCPAIDLDLSTLPLHHTTVGETDDHDSPCGGAMQGDREYRFTAQEDGFYSFDLLTEDSAFVSVIAVEDGPVCGGDLLQCNSSDNRRSQVRRQMIAGQVVTLRVDGDGDEGAYALDVRRRDDVVSCVDMPIPDFMGTPLATTLAADGPDRMTTSCGNTGIWRLGDTDPALIHDFPDLILAFQSGEEPSPGCSATCEIQIVAEFPFYASITDGDSCEGVEEVCMPHENVDPVPSPDVFDLTLQVPEVDGRSKVLVIDRTIPDDDGGPPFPYDYGDSVTVSMSCFGIC